MVRSVDSWAAIDADVASGQITETAAERRAEVAEQADFYGAMTVRASSSA
ncbi:MAG: FHIPEP family type III secretion protein [Planctomycetaceae bacterium]